MFTKRPCFSLSPPPPIPCGIQNTWREISKGKVSDGAREGEHTTALSVLEGSGLGPAGVLVRAGAGVGFCGGHRGLWSSGCRVRAWGSREEPWEGRRPVSRPPHMAPSSWTQRGALDQGRRPGWAQQAGDGGWSVALGSRTEGGGRHPGGDVSAEGHEVPCVCVDTEARSPDAREPDEDTLTAGLRMDLFTSSPT